ncbi:hypothetical protein BDZ91DRAFT_846689 [Kalaharituber pfeilii]|nr:hypothetical protein BDZ91DRAFT_846689 [Kalaharituber pfeilii]
MLPSIDTAKRKNVNAQGCPSPKAMARDGAPLEVLRRVMWLAYRTAGSVGVAESTAAAEEQLGDVRTKPTSSPAPSSHDLPADSDSFSKFYFTLTPKSGPSSNDPSPTAVTNADPIDLEITLHAYETLSPLLRNALLDLLELNMRSMYSRSSAGWSRAKKRAEMKETGMRFLVARPAVANRRAGSASSSEPTGNATTPNKNSISSVPGDTAQSTSSSRKRKSGKSKPRSGGKKSTSPDANPKPQPPDIAGYTSFIVTYEPSVYDVPDAPPAIVVYCYELQVSPSHRNLGLGTHLLRLVETAAAKIGIPDVRLTVFKSNLNAKRFYERLGYVVVCNEEDDDYLILRRVVA